MNTSRNRSGVITIHRLKFTDIVLLVYVFFLMASTSSSTYGYYMAAFFVVVFVLISINLSLQSFFKDRRLLAICVYLFLLLVYGLLHSGLEYTIKQIVANILMFSPILVFYYIKNACTIERKKMFFWVIMLFFFFYFIRAYQLYTVGGIDARYLAMQGDRYGSISIGGGYPLAYAATLICVSAVECLRFIKKKKTSITLLLVLVLIATVTIVYVTTSTTTLIAMLAGMVTALLIPRQIIDSLWKQIVFGVFITLLCLLLIQPIGNLFSIISEQVGGIMGMRLKSLSAMLLGEGVAGDYSMGRLSIPLNSLKTFISHPILGISSDCGIYYYDKLANGAGGHCEWVDALTCFGVFGGLSYLYVFFSSVDKRNSTVAILVTLFILGTFNPFTSNVSCVALFLMLPLINEMKPYFCKTINGEIE